MYDERVRAIVELTRGSRILNLGACGTVKPEGRARRRFLHAALVEAGHSVVGADLNEAGLAWLAKLGYEAVRMDAQAIPAEGEQYDSIVAGELIEHLESPGAFLAGCRRRLKPGGRLVLSTPQPFSPMALLHYVVSPAISNLEHTCMFDQQTLSQLLARCGFAVEEVRYVNDVRLEGGSFRFRVLCLVGRGLCRIVPRRFRTTLVVVARLSDGSTTAPYREHWAAAEAATPRAPRPGRARSPRARS